ncbi:hypothetical protein ACIOWK_27350 [Pseudomonas protegens]|uniref:hypothetical protein n=1 Tax=Pseudomonas protegens TaxID=380021 RepID=UPI0038112531
MNEVKRFRADWRHVVETEFDDAQYVGVADFDRVTAERDALQRLLNAADQKDDDLSFQLNDRKASRYDWLQAAKAAEKRVEVLEQALRFYADGEHYHFESGNWDTVSGEPLNILWCGDEPDFIEDGTVARAALSASAEPSAAKCDRCEGNGKYPILGACPKCGCEPVERDEQQGFAQWTHETVEFEHRGITRKIQRRDLMDLEAEKNAWAGWQARAALDKATEGASHE